jgi:hypothetical protein
MSHIQREILQMLVSSLAPLREASLKSEADTYAKLRLFNLLNHLNMLVFNSYQLLE